MATGGLAGGIAANRPDHTHPRGGTRPQEGQQVKLQQTDQITYILRVEQGHRRVSRWNCSKQIRSHTSWGWNKATEGSTGEIAANRPDHTHSEGGIKPQKGQQVKLQKTDQITYRLRIEQGHRRVRRWNYSKQTRSHTDWGWNNATRVSAGGILANRPDHIHPEGGTRPQKGQQMELQQTGQVTYILRVEQGHRRVSRWNCGKETRLHTS
jgi:proteasome lid subunit RPN8/RPN11